MLSALSPAATRQAATMLSALSPVVGCPELGGATPCFVCGGGVIETVLMVIAAVPLVGVGDAAMDPVAPVVEETNFSLSDLGVKPMISRPAINVEAIAISKGSCSTHTEKEPNENLSSGSDNDDIAVLTRKYKSLKWKYNDLKEFVANAKKSRANANKPPDHGAVNSVYKSLLNQHIHSPSLDGKSKADVIEKTDHGAVKVGIASALEHFHELQSKHFTSSLQELANVFVNLFPNKSIIDPPTSPARNQANVIEGEHISNNNNEEHSKSKSEVQSGTSKPKWDPSPIYDKSQKDLNTISSAAQGSIQQQAKSDQLESPPDLQEFFVDCTQRHKTTKITPAAPPPIGFATPKPRFDRTPIYSKPQNNLHVESTACQGHIEEVQAKEQLDPSFHSQGDSLQAEGNNSPDIECIGHYIPNNLASLEAPSFSLGLDDLEIEGHNEQAPAQLEKNCKPVPQVFNNTSPFQNNDNRQVLLASHSLLEGTHCTNKSPPIQKIVGTSIAVVSTTNKIIDLVTPEALVLSRKSFDRICIDVCIEAERLYNQRRSEENNGIFARNHTSAENVPFYMTPNRVLQPLDPNINYEANNRGTPGSSTCKVAAYGKRRQVVGSKFTTYPYVSGNNRFFVSRIDKAYYDAVISMSTGHSGRLKAIRLTHEEFPHVRFSSLGQSLKPNGKVENFVINSFCRLLFLDHHPKMSKKHYFFNRVGCK